MGARFPHNANDRDRGILPRSGAGGGGGTLNMKKRTSSLRGDRDSDLARSRIEDAARAVFCVSSEERSSNRCLLWAFALCLIREMNCDVEILLSFFFVYIFMAL